MLFIDSNQNEQFILTLRFGVASLTLCEKCYINKYWLIYVFICYVVLQYSFQEKLFYSELNAPQQQLNPQWSLQARGGAAALQSRWAQRKKPVSRLRFKAAGEYWALESVLRRSAFAMAHLSQNPADKERWVNPEPRERSAAGPSGSLEDFFMCEGARQCVSALTGF